MRVFTGVRNLRMNHTNHQTRKKVNGERQGGFRPRPAAGMPGNFPCFFMTGIKFQAADRRYVASSVWARSKHPNYFP